MPEAITKEEKETLQTACETMLQGKKRGGINRNVFIHAHTAKRLGLKVRPGVQADQPVFYTAPDGTVVDKTPLTPVKLCDLCKALGIDPAAI